MLNRLKKSDFVFDTLCKICAYCGYHLLSTDECTAILRINPKNSIQRDPRYDWAIDSISYTYATRVLFIDAGKFIRDLDACKERLL